MKAVGRQLLTLSNALILFKFGRGGRAQPQAQLAALRTILADSRSAQRESDHLHPDDELLSHQDPHCGWAQLVSGRAALDAERLWLAAESWPSPWRAASPMPCFAFAPSAFVT